MRVLGTSVVKSVSKIISPNASVNQGSAPKRSPRPPKYKAPKKLSELLQSNEIALSGDSTNRDSFEIVKGRGRDIPYFIIPTTKNRKNTRPDRDKSIETSSRRNQAGLFRGNAILDNYSNSSIDADIITDRAQSNSSPNTLWYPPSFVTNSNKSFKNYLLSKKGAVTTSIDTLREVDKLSKKRKNR